MKKVIMAFAIGLFTIGLVNAQEGFKLGANVALPVGDAGDISSFSLGLDAKYHWEISDTFYAGVATGFTNAFGKTETISEDGFELEVEFEDVQFLPIAASGKFNASEDFSIGADLGYAVGISDGNDGGFYYRPGVGYKIGGNTELNLSYTGISLDGGTWSTIALGVLFGL
ncbi:outer membrane beta-barrel protein [Allomuricauda sp. d1]|uniref:outer membrane beta-barrel protein n=1 Tax=Allomuricauda sp. d1 TaxID=3136725 RepID=UPI0031E2927C